MRFKFNSSSFTVASLNLETKSLLNVFFQVEVAAAVGGEHKLEG